MPSAAAQTAASGSSVGVRGGTYGSLLSCAAHSGAGSALRSSLPLGVSGRLSSSTNAGRHHVLRQLRRSRRAAPRRRPAPPSADHVGDQPLVARRVLARDHDRLARPAGAAASAASISPSSIRKPRIFTWSSIRPRYSSSPFSSRRARSPVRYSRAPARRERVRHEPLRRQLGAIQIAPRDPGATDIQLARHARSAPAPPARPARTAADPGSARPITLPAPASTSSSVSGR